MHLRPATRFHVFKVRILAFYFIISRRRVTFSHFTHLL